MATDLRPLTIGAILDRAVTLYARHVVAFLAAYAVYWIPFAIAQAVITHAAGPVDLRHVFSLPAPTGTVLPNRSFPAMMRAEAATIPLLLLSLILTPLGNNAVLLTACGYLDGTVVPLPAALRGAARLWLPTIVVQLLFVGLALAGFMVAVIAAVLLVFVASLFRGTGLDVALGIVTAVMALAFALIVGSVLFVTLGMAYVGLVTEDANPVRAFGLAMRRTFDRGMRLRTLLVGLAYSAVELVGLIVFSAGGLVITSLLHSNVVSVVLSVLAQAVLTGLGLVFVLLYTRDVRVRREGADLLLAVETTP